MYCDYWNLKKAPFDNVPDPAMYAACHTSMENAVSETIFAVQEADESFAVIISEAGLGKTLALRLIINALDPVKYRAVLITNPSLSFTQLLKEIIVQITGQPCEEVQKGILLDTLRHLLAASMDQGKKIVIFIDEANVLTPANLEDLRLLTNIQDEKRNLLTLVLAGQLELAQRLVHPQQANLFQRIGSYSRIGKLPSIESVKMYIESRLKRAGANIRIFDDECIPMIWEYSEHGVPRLINKICKLCLKAGETNQFDFISADIVAQVAGRLQKLTDSASIQLPPVRTINVSGQDKNEPRANAEEKKASADVTATEPSDTEISAETESAVNMTGEETEILIQFPAALNILPPEERTATDSSDTLLESSGTTVERISNDDLLKQWEEAISQPSDTAVIAAIIEQDVISPASEASALLEESKTDTNNCYADKEMPPADMASPAADHLDNMPEEPASSAEPPRDVDSDVIIIGEHQVKLGIPKDILKQVKSFNRESANKSAGFWAAQIIKKNPQLTLSAKADPVYLWNEIKDNILKKIAL